MFKLLQFQLPIFQFLQPNFISTTSHPSFISISSCSISISTLSHPNSISSCFNSISYQLFIIPMLSRPNSTSSPLYLLMSQLYLFMFQFHLNSISSCSNSKTLCSNSISFQSISMFQLYLIPTLSLLFQLYLMFQFYPPPLISRPSITIPSHSNSKSSARYSIGV